MVGVVDGHEKISLFSALLTIFLCSLFGANSVAIKISLTGIGPFTTLGVRFAIAAVAIVAWALITHRPIRLKPGQLMPMVVVALIFTAQVSMFYQGLQRTHAARGALISNFYPFFVLVMAHFFIPNDSLTRRKFFGICFGFSGVILIFIDQGGLASQLRTGDGFVFIATFIWACATIYVKRIIHGYEPYQISLYTMVFSVPLFFFGAILWDPVFIIQLDSSVLLALCYQSLLVAGFGFVAWNFLLQRHGATALNSFVFIMPIVGVMSGGLILHEPISSHIWVALLLVAMGLTVIHVNTIRLPPFVMSGDRR